MDITLITSAVFKNNRFEIGYGNSLLYKIKKDLEYFKILTTGHTIVMGYNTWLSIPNMHLKNRRNIVITDQVVKIKKHEEVEYMTIREFKKNKPEGKIYLIGGGKTFSIFLKDQELLPKNLIICHIVPEISIEADCSFDPSLIGNYSLSGYSENITGESLKYRYIYYSLQNNVHQETKYLELMKDILENGCERIDRTCTGTLSLFGTRMKFDISESIPMLTTKRIPFRVILEELLWFCRGDTDAKILQRKGIKIWNGNTTREFLDNRGLNHYPEGIIGPQYGFLWRHYGAKYSPRFADTSSIDANTIGGVDQLKYVEDLLENDPFSRRIIISAWNPSQLNEQALPSCHLLLQFYVTEEYGKRYLSCMFTMRSSDNFLASSFNCVSYSILTYILAIRHNMKPKDLIYVAGDTHIYKNHVEQVREQLKRDPRPFPRLKVSTDLVKKDWKDMTLKDFELIGYFPHPTISASMAI
jgi:thymidylate synthase